MTIWRLEKRRYAREVFRGKGALRVGGRWHRKGAQVAYASEHPDFSELEPTPPEPFRWDSRLFRGRAEKQEEEGS